MSDERDLLRQLLFPKRRRRPGRWAVGREAGRAGEVVGRGAGGAGLVG